MKYFGLFCVLLSVCGVCHSAIIHRVDEDTNGERNFEEEQSLLATGVPDNTLDRNRDDQSDPRYRISEDHRAPFDNLAEAQGELPEETIKEKRCKTEEGNLVGLALKRRDTTANLLRKSCNNCMKAPLCAQKGKCESCKKICEKYGDAVDQSGDELPNNEDQSEVVGIPNRLSNSDSEEGGLSLNDNRYYTMGAFQPGPIHSLLAKLLNIKDVAPIEELVIVAKTKSNKPIKSVRPVVIDTAHVFTLNRGAPSELDVELHEVDKGDDSVNAMATKLDREIEKAMEEKQKLSGTTHLAPREIDRIIMKTLGKDSKQKPSIFSRTISEQDENIQSENEEEDVEEMSPQLPNKQRIGMMGGDDTFQRLVAHDGGRTAQENHANHQAPIEMMDDLTGQQPPVHPDSEIVTEKITTTTKHSKRPHGPSNAEASSSKSPKTTAAPVVSTTKRLKPSPGPESPIHPDSPIKTTTSVPTTIHSNFPHGPKKQDKKKSETATSSAKTVTTSDATTTHPDKALTGQIDVPSRRSHDESLASNDPSDLPHRRPNSNFNERIKSLSKLRQMAARDQESNPRNVDIDSSETIEDEIRIVDQPNDKNQAFNSFVVGESMNEPNTVYEEKYKKLRAWVDENAQMRPPNSVEDTRENLSSNAKEVIDGILTKIDKHLSDITKIRDMPQFGNRNGDKNLEHAPPNGNEFAETRMSPETERKIDEIFARERPMHGQRLSKKLYETHPRSKAAYDEGKWVYKKVTPKRPPYETKHRASSGKENMDKMKSDDQMMAPGSVAERFQQAQLPEHPGQPSPQYLNPVFADRASEPQHSQETVPTGPVQQSKKIAFIDDDPNSTQDHVNHANRGGMSESWSNADSLDAKNAPQEKNEPDDTVACSKEKDEDDDSDHVFKIMHLPMHAMSHGYYRESKDEDGKNDRPFAHHKHRHHETPKHKQSENPLKQITKETQEMISDLNKKHKHGKTEHPHENESHPREDSGIAMHEQNGKHEYFPQDQNHRFSVPNYPGSMKAAEDMQEDVMPGGFMEEPMFIESDPMDQDMIGSPAMRTGLQESLPEDLTHLGRFIPRGKEHSISVHSRDVSEQEKHKNMYFIGDGIKLPLNMREHHDGSLHLSVDVKSLCNCKHCISRQLENGTVIIEAMPLTEQEQQEHEMETQHPTIKENAATSGQTNTNKSSEEDDSFEESDNASHHSESKAGISKRSLRAIRSLLDNEVDSRISKSSDKNDGSEISTPLHSLTREDKVEDKEEDSMKSKLKIFTNVFDFMKNLMLDIESKT